MKWVKRIIGVLVALPLVAVVLLLIAGMRTDAGRIDGSRDIDRDSAEVYRYFTEPKLLGSWTSIEDLQPSDWLRAGVKARFVTRTRGQRIEMECDVESVIPEKSFSLRLRSRPGADFAFEQRLDYALVPMSPRGTRVTVTSRIRFLDTLPRLFEPMLTQAMGEQLEDDLRRLKSVVEAAPGAASSK